MNDLQASAITEEEMKEIMIHERLNSYQDTEKTESFLSEISQNITPKTLHFLNSVMNDENKNQKFKTHNEDLNTHIPFENLATESNTFYEANMKQHKLAVEVKKYSTEQAECIKFIVSKISKITKSKDFGSIETTNSFKQYFELLKKIINE